MVKNLPAVWDPGLIPRLGRSPGIGNGNPLQYSCLENPMERGAWQAPVHGVAEAHTWAPNTATAFCEEPFLELEIESQEEKHLHSSPWPTFVTIECAFKQIIYCRRSIRLFRFIFINFSSLETKSRYEQRGARDKENHSETVRVKTRTEVKGGWVLKILRSEGDRTLNGLDLGKGWCRRKSLRMWYFGSGRLARDWSAEGGTDFLRTMLDLILSAAVNQISV